MTKEQIYERCVETLYRNKGLLMELPTGYGKTKASIDLINLVSTTEYPNKTPTMLLLVAKIVHKQTWKEEFEKWGGIKPNVTIECYESLKKHVGESFDFICMDEVHHIQSDTRLDFLSEINFTYLLGLSATIPRDLKSYFKFNYHIPAISYRLEEAIEDEILPEPQILLYPLQLDNVAPTETWVVNPKTRGVTEYGTMKDLWKYKRSKVHAILSCTQKQKSDEMVRQIKWDKDTYMATRNESTKRTWLYHCGKRLEYYADIKVPIVKDILNKLNKNRTITFCKTIDQTEKLGKWCIHSKNGKATKYYEAFNNKEIDHITAVNILNENANLVDCKYAIFCNLSASDIMVPQRIGRSLRHPNPVIIVPFYKGTREEELVDKMIEGFNPEYIKTIYSINEI